MANAAAMEIRLFHVIGALCLAPMLCGQTVLDGAYIREHTPTRRPVPYVPLREADVMCAQRVWRIIDLHEKINLPLYYPLEPAEGRKSLFDVIHDALLRDGSLTAYDPGPVLQDDSFSKVLTTDQIKDLLEPMTTTLTPSLEDPEVMDTVTQADPVGTANVTRYQLKEDWIFDRQRGVMEVRIIGLAPMREVRGEDGELRGHSPLFWLYFPELRYVLANEEAFNRRNDAERRSFDQLFASRCFSSMVIKTSNVYNRPIIEHTSGLDAVLEGERVQRELFEREHDLWNF